MFHVSKDKKELQELHFKLLSVC